jgi:hypothetical protein
MKKGVVSYLDLAKFKAITYIRSKFLFNGKFEKLVASDKGCDVYEIYLEWNINNNLKVFNISYDKHTLNNTRPEFSRQVISRII